MEITCDPDEPGVCPHCLRSLQWTAACYVEEGDGHRSRMDENEKCDHCGKWFSAYRNPGTSGLITFDQQEGE